MAAAEIDELWDQRECVQLCPYYLDIQGEQLRLQVGFARYQERLADEVCHRRWVSMQD